VISLICTTAAPHQTCHWNVTFPPTGDATGFHGTMHGKFKVADTIVLDGYTRQWEVAPKRAQLRTKQGDAYCREWGFQPVAVFFLG